MVRRITVIQGHPDSSSHHLLHAMADAYAESATAAGHEVRRIEVAKIEFPLLRTQVDFETGDLPLVWRKRGMTCAGRSTGCFYFRSGMEPCQRYSRAFLNIFPAWVCYGIQEERIPETATRRPVGPHCRNHGDASAALSLVFRRFRTA